MEYAGGVAKDASATRDALIRAGERLFASRGVDGALTQDIVRAAGQANGSAVQYHFGSRQGLLLAIATKHITRMEPARHEHLERLRREQRTGDPTGVVDGIVAPTAAELDSEDGCDFLRIIAQLAGHAGFRVGAMPEVLLGTALREQLELLNAYCASILPESLAHERVATSVGLLTAMLADRARQLEAGERIPLDHQTFVDNLVLMMVGAISAPVPTAARSRVVRR